MEPPAKRPRLALYSHFNGDDGGDDDELNFEPEEISRRRDPSYQLQQERAVAANRLKSTFEHIFEKYERDFSEVGDEIDLRTGEIVVNNGHLLAMRNEKDVGEDFEEDEGMLLSEMCGSESDDEPLHNRAIEEEHDEEGEEEEEENRILQGRAAKTGPSTGIQLVPRQIISPSRQPPLPTPVRLASQHRLASLGHSRYTPLKPSPLSSGAWEIDESLLDPAWRAPPLLQPSLPTARTPDQFGSFYQLPATDGSRSLWASGSSNMQWPSGSFRPQLTGPRIASSPTRKLLLAAPEDDDDDEILMGGSQKTGNGPEHPKSTRSAARRQTGSKPSLSRPKHHATNKKAERGERVATGSSNQRNKRPPSKPSKTPSSRKLSSKSGDSSKPELPNRKLTNQALIVAIPFRRAPTPESLTIVDDTSPRSVQGVASFPFLPLPNLEEEMPDRLPFAETPDVGAEPETESMTLDLDQPPLAPPEDVTTNDGDLEPQPPSEKFSRNKIDPSYEFSDEDELPTKEPAAEPAPPAHADKELLPEPQPVAKRRPGRPKGSSRKRKLEQEDSSAVTEVAAAPLSLPARTDHEQAPTHEDTVIRDSEDDLSFPNVEDFPPLDGYSMVDIDALIDQTLGQDPTDVADVPDIPDVIEQPVTYPDIPPSLPLHSSAFLSPAKVSMPSPLRSDDSLGVALDAIIASQRLFEDSDQNPNSSPLKLVDDSPTRQALAQKLSPNKQRRSVHFLEKDIQGKAIQPRPRIISTPPMRKDLIQLEEREPEVAPSPKQVAESQEAALEHIQPTSPSPEARSAVAGGMFAAHKARRRKGASLSSSPVQKPATPLHKQQPSIKRRSLLSISLGDSDDEDPLNAMSLLTTWTKPVGRTPRINSPATASGSRRRRTGTDSTIRKRIAREGFGGLSTPTKKRSSLAVGSPTGSIVLTPGGHARRCGVNGFRCDRDFCFTCLSG